MNLKTTGICLSVLLVIVFGIFWLNPETKPSSTEAQFQAAFLRPISISTKGERFSIQFNGQDALAYVVKVESGHNIEVVARFPPLPLSENDRSQSIQIVPRLLSQGDDAFQWFDTRTECFVTWGGSPEEDPHQERPPKCAIRFKLRPGEYRLRYYLQIKYLHPESGLPEKYLLAESRMTVTGDPKTGFLPLEDPKNMIRVESE